jgi:Ca2+-binding RTX toxin-like protein
MLKYKIACAAVFSVASFASAKASAVVTITSPFTNAGIAIGAAGATGGAMVACFEEGGFGSGMGFRMEHLGFSAGLSDDFVIVGGSGNDVVIFVQSTTTSFCGLTLSPLKYNGHFLDIHGVDGADFILGAQGDTFYFGGVGNDMMFHYSPIGRSFGGAGNDQVLSFSSGNGDRIFGESGADCLFDSTATFITYDCGSGSDKFSNSPKPPGTVSCETATSCCGLCL